MNNTYVVKTKRRYGRESSNNTETRPNRDKKTGELWIKTFWSSISFAYFCRVKAIWHCFFLHLYLIYPYQLVLPNKVGAVVFIRAWQTLLKICFPSKLAIVPIAVLMFEIVCCRTHNFSVSFKFFHHRCIEPVWHL